MTKSRTSALIAIPVHHLVLAICALLASLCLPAAQAQPTENDLLADPDTTAEHTQEDQHIQARITGVYQLLEPLTSIEVEVREGVVLLSGSVSNNAHAERALSLASQFAGVVTVDDRIERRLDVQGNLTPMLEDIKSDLNQWTRALPLIGLALLIFSIVVYLGYSVAGWSRLWLKLTPNPFVAELAAQAVRIVSIIVGLVVTLNLLGATALMATILGGAGVVGLAIGFAVRDTMENYISSIMLSLRQPFRANDHVVINTFEGKVVRLTSRATVLMTLDGNQLRIPNATVFKGVILNYTRNPQRRFIFDLGVDSAEIAARAIRVGVDAMQSLPFVLKEPRARALVASVGDTKTTLRFTGWINQHETDFDGARSLAIQKVTSTLDEQGFAIPEPIHRFQFDAPATEQPVIDEVSTPSIEQPVSPEKPTCSIQTSGPDSNEAMDVLPDTHIDGMVNEERAMENETDLLDARRPVE